MAKHREPKDRTCKFCGDEAPYDGLCEAHYRRAVKGVTGPALAAPVRHITSTLSRLQNVSPIVEGEKLEDTLLKFLTKNKKKAFTLETPSDQFNTGVGRIRSALAELKVQGFNIADPADDTASLENDLPKEPSSSIIDTRQFEGDQIEFGFTCDNHLCSKYARNDVLNALFDIWAAKGITYVLQGGNMIDGEANFNRYDLLTRPGLDAQAEYLINEWPYRNGMRTEFICGDDHEGWYVQRDGINIAQYLQHKANEGGRNDMIFLGYMEHTFRLATGNKNAKTTMSLLHAGGGSAYATSYTVQKIVESYQPNEKPSILLVGHFHKFAFDYPRAVLAIQGGCTQDQTPFLRKKRIEAMVGGCTISFNIDKLSGAPHNFNVAWHPFYDRDFYRRWGYVDTRKDQIEKLDALSELFFIERYADRLRVYIAGPYTVGDTVANIRKAVDAAEVVLAAGHLPFVPHMNYAWCMVHPHDAETWYMWDLHWMACCDAVIRLPGESPGSDREVAVAMRLDIPTFTLEEFVKTYGKTKGKPN